MTPDIVWKSVQYVEEGPFFWAAMGFTTAVAMFIGAIIYDGQLNLAKKGMVSIVSYVGILLWMTSLRVVQSVSGSSVAIHPERAFAGMVSMVVMTFFWTLGILAGVIIFKDCKFRNRGKGAK